MYSVGYVYNIDKRNENSINWRCVQYRIEGCGGRATSGLYGPPVTITKGHDHLPNRDLRGVMKAHNERCGSLTLKKGSLSLNEKGSLTLKNKE